MYFTQLTVCFMLIFGVPSWLFGALSAVVERSTAVPLTNSGALLTLFGLALLCLQKMAQEILDQLQKKA